MKNTLKHDYFKLGLEPKNVSKYGLDIEQNKAQKRENEDSPL